MIQLIETDDCIAECPDGVRDASGSFLLIMLSEEGDDVRDDDGWVYGG